MAERPLRKLREHLLQALHISYNPPSIMGVLKPFTVQPWECTATFIYVFSRVVGDSASIVHYDMELMVNSYFALFSFSKINCQCTCCSSRDSLHPSCLFFLYNVCFVQRKEFFFDDLLTLIHFCLLVVKQNIDYKLEFYATRVHNSIIALNSI